MNLKQIDKRIVKKRFSRHAHEYDQYADVQCDMAAALLDDELVLERLKRWRENKQTIQMLDIGCGTGLLTALILAQLGEAHITLLDLSKEMLDEAEQKLVESGLSIPLHKIEADAEAWISSQTATFDMIVSNAALQWFHEPCRVLQHAAALLRPGGLLACSTFLPGTLYELHHSCSAADHLLGRSREERGQTYAELHTLTNAVSLAMNSRWAHEARVKRAACTVEPASTLFGTERMRISSRALTLTYEYDSARQMMKHIRGVGASNALQDRTHMVTRSWIHEMLAYYEHTYPGSDGEGVQATYEVGLLSALNR